MMILTDTHSHAHTRKCTLTSTRTRIRTRTHLTVNICRIFVIYCFTLIILGGSITGLGPIIPYFAEDENRVET